MNHAFAHEESKGNTASEDEEHHLRRWYLASVNEKGGCYTRIIQNCKKRTLHAIMGSRIALSSTIYSDTWRGYNGLVDVGFDKHYRVNHGKDEFSNKRGTHISDIEAFWSFCKRRLMKFNGTKKNFPFHLKECEWRWKKTHQEQYENLLQIVKVLV